MIQLKLYDSHGTELKTGDLVQVDGMRYNGFQFYAQVSITPSGKIFPFDYFAYSDAKKIEALPDGVTQMVDSSGAKLEAWVEFKVRDGLNEQNWKWFCDMQKLNESPAFVVREYEDKYSDLNNKLRAWALDKGILTQGTILGQAKKVVEEANELLEQVEALEYFKSNAESDEDYSNIAATEFHISLELGDVFVSSAILAQMLGYDLVHYGKIAYDKIKTRTGKMEGGVFVKESDMPN